MRKIVLMLCAVAFVFAGACSQSSSLKIDMSGPENFQTSMQAIANSLNQQEQQEFAAALQIVVNAEAQKLMAAQATDAEIEAAFKNLLDGKTVKDILSQAKKIQKALN